MPPAKKNEHTPEENLPAKQQPKPPAFRANVNKIATSLMTDWVGEDRAGEAVGRIAAALTSARASARDPRDFDLCTPESVGHCVAVAALTGIMPSTGAGALAYVIPQRPRRDDPPQLQYRLSHRGLAALALRSGMHMTAIPVGMNDELTVTDDGRARIAKMDLDNPPETMDELRGVIVVVKSEKRGHVIHSGFLAKKLIEKRRAMSLSYKANSGPWIDWPIEQAMKTAMHYAASRGWCVIDDTAAIHAMVADVTGDNTIDAVKVVRLEETPKGVEALGAALEDAS